MKGNRMLPSRIFLVVLLQLQLLWAPSSNAEQLVPGMFMLGDSLLDVGTNSYIPGCNVTANFGPYGESYFNPPTGRFSNGLLISDILAQRLGLPSFSPPYIQPGASFANGINFASAGSGLLPTTRASELVVSMDRQVEQFLDVQPQLQKQYGESLISDSIYMISSGGNDLGVYFANAAGIIATPPPTFVAQLVYKLNDVVTTLYNSGARKIVVMLLSPLGCSPFVRALSAAGPLSSIPGCVELVNDAILGFNDEVANLVMDLRSTLIGINLVYVDPYDTLYEYINAGGSTGFTQGSLACCGAGPYNGAMQCGIKDAKGHHMTTLCSKNDLSTYVFFDNFHPTEAAYTLLVQASYDRGNASISHPIDIKTLVSL